MTQGEVRTSIFDRELKLRVVSALILASLALLMDWIGGATFSLLWAALSLVVLYEYNRICSQSLTAGVQFFSFSALILVIAAYHTAMPMLALWISVISVVALATLEFVQRRSAWGALGLGYAILPFLTMSDLRSDDMQGLILILILFAVVWGTDIFAYFFGRTLGGPKLAPRISPKKTWSGFFGGLVGGVALSTAVVWIAGYLPNHLFMMLMVLLSLSTQIGDLMESWLKRYFDVKDSGAIIPGHGGILDRIDGLIFAGAILWLVLEFMQISRLADATPGVVFEDFFLIKL